MTNSVDIDVYLSIVGHLINYAQFVRRWENDRTTAHDNTVYQLGGLIIGAANMAHIQ